MPLGPTLLHPWMYTLHIEKKITTLNKIKIEVVNNDKILYDNAFHYILISKEYVNTAKVLTYYLVSGHKEW